MIWATYYGGSEADNIGDVALGPDGEIAITGHTWSTNFPVSANAAQKAHGRGHWDQFAVVFGNDGSRRWATYNGGYDTDIGNGVVFSEKGDLFMVGYTGSANFTVTPGAIQDTFQGAESDVTIALYDTLGALRWATFLGSSSLDYGNAVAFDPRGRLVLTGYTLIENFPITPGAFQTTRAGYMDVFITSITLDTSLVASAQTLADRSTGVTIEAVDVDPVDGRITLSITLDRAQHIEPTLYSIDGCRIPVTTQRRWLPAGEQRLSIETGALPSGAYIVQLLGGRGAVSRRLDVVR